MKPVADSVYCLRRAEVALAGTQVDPRKAREFIPDSLSLTLSLFPTDAMPELPEVEAARSAIADHCIGKKIVRAIIANDPKVIDGVSPSDFEASILNKTIVAAHRKGKNLWIQLDSPPFPTFQFGMTGAIYIKGVAVTKYKRSAVNDTDEWPSKFSKFFIELNDGLELSFTDKRRFAKVRLLDDPPSVPPISELGPDALLEPMTEDEFFTALRKKKIAIKTLLLDQSFISGIGNWVADEVLYQARIHPLEITSSLSREDSARLLKCIKEVLEKAIKVGADSGQYPSNWIFHSRENKPGKAFVDGKKVDFINVGGRTTAYVPELQKLSRGQATKAPAKLRKKASKKNMDDDENNDFDANSDDDDVDAGKSDGEEEERGNVKSKQKNSKGGGNKPPRRQKPAKSGEDDDSDDEDDRKMAAGKRKLQGVGGNENENKSKKSTMTKKARTEVKPKENIDSDASDDNDDDSRDQKRTRKARGKKPQPKKQTSKKVK